jgi:acyl-CoA thioester hydrolase
MTERAKADRPEPHRRADYLHFAEIPTRWMDNDIYGHVNNVQYYSFFDTVVNGYLIDSGVLIPQSSPVIGLVVETHCNFFESLSFPQTVDAGLRVARLGQSSVRYEIGLFTSGADVAVAQGHFVHVYVDRETRRPVLLPNTLHDVLSGLVRAPARKR